jgi:hypothetical protein
MAAAAGLGPRAVDDLAGLYPGHARQLLNGSKSLMRATTALALARIFGTTVKYIIEGDGVAPTDRTVRKAVARARDLQSIAPENPVEQKNGRTVRVNGAPATYVERS